MDKIKTDLLNDVKSINGISAVANILEVICRTTGMGFAAVARVTEDKWVACAVKDLINFGLKPGGELEIQTTICDEIRQHHEPVIIDHVAEDPQFAAHHTPLQYGFQSYISFPIIRKNGEFFGTLCAIDPKPAALNTPAVIGMFKLFSELIVFHLDAIDQLAASESSLLEEKQTAELRDQFIAILGHDLRNPVGAVLNATQVLQRIPLDDRAKKLTTIIQNSSYRIKGLIDNVLDFARGRIGEGMTLNSYPNEKLAPILEQIITELKLIWPDSTIETNFDLEVPVHCDRVRIAQLFSNLLGNALSHGLKNAPILVEAVSNVEKLKICITNQGKEIPKTAMERLFQPFSRGEIKTGQQGLGLGLYISSEIARAHNGTLSVDSTAEKTCFTLEIPTS